MEKNTLTSIQVGILLQTTSDALHPAGMVEPTQIFISFFLDFRPRPQTFLIGPRVVESVVGLAPVEHPHNFRLPQHISADSSLNDGNHYYIKVNVNSNIRPA